jgi:hypothetical protein
MTPYTTIHPPERTEIMDSVNFFLSHIAKLTKLIV